MQERQDVDVLFAVLGTEKILVYGEALLQHIIADGEAQHSRIVELPVRTYEGAEALREHLAGRTRVTMAELQHLARVLEQGERALAQDPHGGGAPGVTQADISREVVARYAPLLQRGVRLPSYHQPEVTWQVTPACDPTFAAAMRQAWARLNLMDRTHISAAECRVLQYQRMHGAGAIVRRGLRRGIRLQEGSPETEGAWFLTALANLIGDKLFALLGPEAVAQWWPYHDLRVAPGPTDRSWVLRCDSLCTHGTRDGRGCHYAAARPTVRLQGQRRVVAFTPHAIQRITERLTVAQGSYATMGDIFAYLNYSRYFAPAELHPQKPAFAMFDACMPGFVSGAYLEAILDNPDPQTAYAYRMGYCPVVLDGDVWVATTLLVPGFTGTPEYGTLLKASLAPGVKERMLAACETLSYAQVATRGDFSLLRWFHTHGVPQVIPAPPHLFDYGA